MILLTLLFFSSSNTGFLGRGDGEGIKVASRGISGSAKTIPTIENDNRQLVEHVNDNFLL